MATPVNTFQDILNAMEKEPALRDNLRRQILSEDLLQLPVQFREFTEEQRTANREFHTRFENADRRMSRMEQDGSQLKDFFLTDRIRTDAENIPTDLGMTFIRTLSTTDLANMAQGRPDRNTARSFRHADLIILAERDGTEHYIAIEASWTADHRDSDRALRNANLLTTFTGNPATAAVLSIRNDSHVQEQSTPAE